MNKKGFTLMELLLVVAILAIVAAAAAPTFTSGAGDALKEARKSAFLGAYQNTVTGAHMMVAIAAAKAIDIVAASGQKVDLDAGTDKTDGKGADKHNLNYYSPFSTRQFRANNGDQYYCGACVDDKHQLYITYFKVATNANPADSTDRTTKVIDMYANGQTSTQVLDSTWATINGETTTTTTNN